MRLNIRWKLTLWYSLAMAVVLLVFGGLVYGLLGQTHERIHQALEQRVARTLQPIDGTLANQIRQLQQDPRMAADAVGRLRHWIFEFKEHDNIFCVVFDQQGKVFAKTEELADGSVPSGPEIQRSDSSLHDATIPLLGRQRVLTDRIRLPHQEYSVVLMASLAAVERARAEVDREQAEVDNEFRNLLAILIASGPLALLLVGGTGYLLARKGLAPMDQLTRLTEEFTVAHLHRRLPIANPGDELGRLTQTINRMIGRLESSFQEILRFTADASHELRTPLTAIRTETEVALTRSMTNLDYQHLLGSILEECHHLTHLTDQLLTLSREDVLGARQARQPVELTAIVEKVIDSLHSLAESKSLHLHNGKTVPLRVLGDEARLRRVFINLLDNAIKYTPEGGTVEVDFACQDKCAVVSVRDTGPGIPPEHLPHVFERFYRINKARSRDQGGAGLGLSIARSIVLSHEGQIEMTSTLGQGTTVTVTLPRA
jgi:heavy metal sensor kinase